MIPSRGGEVAAFLFQVDYSKLIRKHNKFQADNCFTVANTHSITCSQMYLLQGLFMTDNSSVDAAASWVLDNQHLPDIDEPFKV